MPHFTEHLLLINGDSVLKNACATVWIQEDKLHPSLLHLSPEGQVKISVSQAHCHWDMTNSSTAHLAFIKDFYGYLKQPANPSQSPVKDRNRDLVTRRALVNLTEPGLDSLEQTREALKSCLRTHGIWVQNNNNSKIPVEVTTDPLVRFFLLHRINLQK